MNDTVTLGLSWWWLRRPAEGNCSLAWPDALLDSWSDRTMWDERPLVLVPGQPNGIGAGCVGLGALLIALGANLLRLRSRSGSCCGSCMLMLCTSVCIARRLAIKWKIFVSIVVKNVG